MGIPGGLLAAGEESDKASELGVVQRRRRPTSRRLVGEREGGERRTQTRGVQCEGMGNGADGRASLG